MAIFAPHTKEDILRPVTETTSALGGLTNRLDTAEWRIREGRYVSRTSQPEMMRKNNEVRTV